MNKPRRFVSLLLIVPLTCGIHFTRAEGPLDLVEKSECDMKKVMKVPKCAKCERILMGFKCPDCTKGTGKCAKCKGLFSSAEIKDNKCPCCGNNRLVEAQLVAGDKCLLCEEPFQMVEVCVRQVYACSCHPNYQDLKAGNCQEIIRDAKGNKRPCGEKLALSNTSYSETAERYVCPKCGDKHDAPGKCEACKETLARKKLCTESGNFPHTGEAKWSLALKKYSEQTSEKLDTDLIMASQPEVVVFEGTRTPQLKSWTYLVYCPKTKEAAIVDASCDADELGKTIDEKKLKVKYIFTSHGHNDHVVTQGQIQKKCRDAKVVRFNSPLRDNDNIKLGELTLRIFHTPGHAADCIVIWVGKMLFAGDSFDSQAGQEETKKRLKGKGAFDVYGGHVRWSSTY